MRPFVRSSPNAEKCHVTFGGKADVGQPLFHPAACSIFKQAGSARVFLSPPQSVPPKGLQRDRFLIGHVAYALRFCPQKTHGGL